MSNDDLMRKARLAAMLEASGEAAPPPKPTAKKSDDALVSDNTKAALKTAGTLAGMAGKWGLGKAKQAAAVTAEKTKEAQEAAVAKFEAAQHARAEAAVAKESAPAETSPDIELTAHGSLVTDGMVSEAVVLPDAESEAPLEGIATQDIAEALPQTAESDVHDEPGSLSIEPLGSDAQEEAQTVVEEADYTTTFAAPLSASTGDPELVLPIEDPLGEPAPLPDDPYSEELSQPTTGTDDEPGLPRKIWPWAAGGVVCLGLVAFFAFGPSDTVPKPAATPTPSVAMPPAPVEVEPPMDVPAAVVDQPDLVPVAVEVAPAVEPAPEPDEARAVEPQPVVVEQPAVKVEPKPVARAVQAAPRATPQPAERPAPRPVQRAPAAPAKVEPQWQDKAKQDMDRWAQDMGIE